MQEDLLKVLAKVSGLDNPLGVAGENKGLGLQYKDVSKIELK